MSGNDVRAAANGWKVYNPQTNAGKFDKWDVSNELFVIVSKGRSGKIGKFYLTKAVLKALGNPKYIQTMERGDEIGLMGVNTKPAYAVQDKSNVKNATPFIACKSFIDDVHLKDGAYQAHNEGGVVVFSKLQNPSQI